MEGSYSQAGFYYQNNVAALKIIDCLILKSDIHQIRLENYDKGNHIDDIIVYRENKIEYYQVKWSENEDKVYTLHNLLQSSENDDGKTTKKSLFKQLAEGYISAKKNSENFSITLHTVKKESPHKRPSSGLNFGLTEIRTNFFDIVKVSSVRYDALAEYQSYRETIDIIRKECELDEDSFDEFIKNLEFKFKQEPTDQIQNIIRVKLEALGIEGALLDKLLNAAVKWSISGEAITKDILLKELGILDRFEDKLSHYFKIVDDEHYVRNQSLFHQLEKALSELDRGYIFIEGLPGVGKSTALTKFKESNPDVALSYYCFIPDVRNNFGEFRHQSEYFLKSLCISLEKNFPEVDLPSRYSDKYQEKFNWYLEKISGIKRKVIIIVDGLDHVHRGTAPGDKSLLNSITGDLPENIFFILSSQYDTVLSPSVKLQITSDSRRHIKVNPFTQKEIKEYMENKNIAIDEHINLLEQVTGGIPIYLHYLSEMLLNTSRNNYEETIKNLPQLTDGEINTYHEYLYQRIENNGFARWILAVLAYRKENTSLQTIREILKLAGEDRNITEIEDVIKDFQHLLRQVEGRSYTIFHNSFREFIITKAQDLKERFNIVLAAFYQTDPFTDDAYRNYFSHLYEIGDFDKVLENTTLEWLKSAWSHFRALEETKDNLNISIKAAIKKGSISEFIRIVFLKAQFDRSKWNLDNSDVNFTILLLDAGQTANSLRTIWDGDFLSCSKEFFYYYLGKYYNKTGSILPRNILKQGLSKSLIKQNVETLTSEYKAEAILYNDIDELFKDIDDIKWLDADSNKRSYIKKKNSEEENSKINERIKTKVVDYLVEFEELDKLFQLSKAYGIADHVSSRIHAGIFKLLLPVASERQAAINAVQKIDFSKVSDKMYYKLISFSSDYLNEDEIKSIFPSRIKEPELYNEIVVEARMDFILRKEIINLFDDLKAVWIFQPELFETLLENACLLHGPSEDIYDSIFSLSRLWNDARTGVLERESILENFKECIDCLCVRRSEYIQERSSGLFDMNTDNSFISRDIKYLYKNIFQLAVKLLTNTELEDLVDYWISIDQSANFNHYSTGLTISRQIFDSELVDTSSLLNKIILHAEKIAREEQDTGTLSGSLAEVSRTYGYCGFKDEFKRVYDQIIEISFGLGYRKDYQASNIVKPLEYMHLQDPEGTLKRLSEVFYIQDKLGEAGNGRMRHICMCDLIAFTSTRYPALSFTLLQLEEDNIARSEAMSRIIGPMINNSTESDLVLYLALVKTVIRLKDTGTSDGHFIHLAKKILNKAIRYNTIEIIEEVLELIRYNLEVELKDEKELIKFSGLLSDKGFDPAHYSFPVHEIPVAAGKEESASEEDSIEKIKFVSQLKKNPIDEVITLYNTNKEGFIQYIKTSHEILTSNKRNQILRKEFKSSANLFDRFLENLTEPQKLIFNGAKDKIVQRFATLKNTINNLDSTADVSLQEIKTNFYSLVDMVDSLFTEKLLSIYIEDQLEIDQWLEIIAEELNARHVFLFEQILTSKEIIKLVDQCSTADLKDLSGFVDKWCKGRTRTAALLKIANRLTAIDPSKAKEIVLSVSQFEYDSILFQKEDDPDGLDFDIFESILKMDQEFGKKFLLESYISQNSRYSGDLTSSMDKLLKYSDYFEDNAVQTYYESNLLYNNELAAGLPNKLSKYGFLTGHKENYGFSEIIIKHLVWLFNYPVFKVRELALQSMLDLVIQDSFRLNLFIKLGIEKGSNNEIEYSFVVLQALALKEPSMLIAFKAQLLSLLDKEHFNILEQCRALLLLLQESDTKFLSSRELSRLGQINGPSKKIKLLSKLPDWLSKGILWSSRLFAQNTEQNTEGRRTVFVYAPYQLHLINKLSLNQKEGFAVKDFLYDDMSAKGLLDYDGEQESIIHRRYNINTNFDTIEIYSPYYDELKSSINKVLCSGVHNGSFESFYIDEIKALFRVYDPSKLLYREISKPNYINWIPEDITKADYLRFTDFETMAAQLATREKDYITLAEYGSQRVNRYKVLHGTCYFEVSAFLKNKDGKLKKLKLYPYLEMENQYAFEISSPSFTSSLYKEEDSSALIHLSRNNFRGHSDITCANLLSDLFVKAEIKPRNLLEIICQDDDYPLKACRWISASTSSTDRRRYEPASEGFNLKIKKEVLVNYLRSNNMKLCYHIKLERAAEEYISENRMAWFDLDRIIEIDL